MKHRLRAKAPTAASFQVKLGHPIKIRLDAIVPCSLGDGAYLISFQDGKEPVLVSESVFSVARLASHFATRQEHTSNALATLRLGESFRSEVDTILDQLLECGILVSDSELYEVARVQEGLSPRTKLMRIAIPTRNRAAALKSTVLHWQQYALLNDRQIECVIAEDSDCEIDRTDVRKCVHSGDAITLRFIGRREKADFICRLSKLGVPVNVANFALFGTGEYRPGANRNCLVLDSVGEALLMSDDDVECSFLTIPTEEPSVRLSSHSQLPFDCRVFSEREDAIASVRPARTEIFTAHEALLGRRGTAIIADAYFQNRELLDVCNHMLSSFKRRDMRIVATQAGIVGDNGRDDCDEPLFMPGPSMIARMLESRSAYDEQFLSREVVQIARCYTITHSSVCMTPNIGLDATRLLPPFMPAFRGEDRVFGAACTALSSNAFMGHIPIAVLHVPIGPRTYLSRKYDSVVRPKMSDLVAALIFNGADTRLSCEFDQSLRAIGQYFHAVSSLQQEDFLAQSNNLVRNVSGACVRAACEQSDRIARIPEYWTDDVMAYKSAFLARAREPDYAVPREVKRSARPVESTQAFLSEIGTLFDWWPQIWFAAREMKLTGVRISTP
jgi:hypothetical protein